MIPALELALQTPGPLTSWSYSRLSDYQQCPRKAYYKYVEKRSEPPNQAMQRGTRIHSQLESYLNWEMEHVPKEGFHFSSSLEEIRLHNAVAEESWAFTSEWGPTAWMGPDTWLRLKIDANVEMDGVLHTIDFKTGQIRMSHQDQLELYALASMKLRPGHTTYITENWYLDQNERTVNQYLATDENRLQDKWEGKVVAMMSDRHFDPTPNALCKWCHFRKSNGGPCDY